MKKIIFIAFTLVLFSQFTHAGGVSSSYLQTAQKMYKNSQVVAVPQSSDSIIVRKNDGTIISIYINCSDYRKWTKTVILYPECKEASCDSN